MRTHKIPPTELEHAGPRPGHGAARKRRWRYEHRSEPLLPRPQFRLRMLRHAGMAAILIAAALGIGIAGYHWLEDMPWIDAFLNAAMILGGMGPVGEMHTSVGKLFAGCYALFSGIVFIATAGILIAAPAHRLLHRLHMEEDAQT